METMDNPEEEDRLVTAFFVNIFAQLLAHFQFWFDWITNRFRFFNRTGDGFQPRNIINNLIENFGSEEIKFIHPNETAEEAFERKIREKDYEAAQKLAKKFDFDPELIYQSMWKTEKVDKELIRNRCLGKSQNILWILEQCCSVVPVDYEVLKELWTFGLERSCVNPFKSDCVKDSKESVKEPIKNTDDFLKDSSDSIEDEQQVSNEEENGVLKAKELAFERYRNILLLFNSRLKLYEMILHRRFGDDFSAHFESEFFSTFRFKTAFQLAIEFANQSQIDALEILIRLENRGLRKHLLTILSNVPETLMPTEYRVVLDMLFDHDADKNESIDKKIEQNTEQELFSEENVLQPTFERRFYNETTEFNRIPDSGPIDKNVLLKWFQDRSIIIAEYTMLIENSLSLLNIGVNHGIDELKEIFVDMDIYSMLVYEGQTSLTISFTEFQAMTQFQKMNHIFENQDPVYALEVMFEQFLNKMTRFSQKNGVDRKRLLKEFVVKLAEVDFEKCIQVFRNYSMADKTLDEIQQLKGISDAIELIELAIECLRTYSKPEMLEMAFEILTCLPHRDEAENLFKNDSAKKRAFNKVNDQADQIEDLLSILDVFQSYNTRLTLSTLEEIIHTSDSTSLELFLEQVLQNFCNKTFAPGVDSTLEWKNFYWNLQDFRKKYMNTKVKAESLLSLSVKCLLFSGKIEYVKLAIKQIAFNPNKVSEKKLPAKEGKELLKKAAFDYVKFANPAHDSNLELAELCLKTLLEQETIKEDIDDEVIREELDLVKAVQMMGQDFGYTVLPMKIKQIPQPRLLILEGLLQETSNSYTKVSKLIKISQLLRVHRDRDDSFREGKVLQAVGEEALRQSDFPVALEVCSLILERNLEHGWELCKVIGRIEDLGEEVISRERRLALLSFALAFCPETDVDAHFEILNHIRVLKGALIN